MAWIDVIGPDRATGALKSEYDLALKRAGRVWNIVSIMSQNAPVMRASLRHYAAIMFGESPLSRVQREMLATVVSAENHCLY